MGKTYFYKKKKKEYWIANPKEIVYKTTKRKKK